MRYNTKRQRQTRICTADNENGKRNHAIIEVDLEIEVFTLRKKNQENVIS